MFGLVHSVFLVFGVAYYLPSVFIIFQNPPGGSRLKDAWIWLAFLLYACVFSILWFSLPSDFPVGFGPSLAFFLALAGVILHAAAVFALGADWKIGIQKSGLLTTDGVFGLVRHPAYNAAFVFYLGLALLSGFFAASVSMAVVGIYLLVRINFEEIALKKHFGPAYLEYSKNVPATFLGLFVRHAVPSGLAVDGKEDGG